MHYFENNNSTKLILFITGWGMDKNPTQFLSDKKYDVCTLYNYPDLSNDLSTINFELYDEVIFVAWSLGVFAANVYYNELPIKPDYTIAINGTGLPVDNRYGIPTKVFALTLKTWSEKARINFNKRMCCDDSSSELFSKYESKRTVDDQKQELNWCFNNAQSDNFSMKWDLAIIASNDKIFPPDNMLEYWSKQNVRIKKINKPHYPFAQWNSWDEIRNELKQ